MISLTERYLLYFILGLFAARIALPDPRTPSVAVFLFAVLSGLLLLLTFDLIAYLLRRENTN